MGTYEKYVELRDAKGVKDAAVSNGAGVSKSTFSDWKSGRSTPKQPKLQKIADYFGVPVDYFTGEQPQMVAPALSDFDRLLLRAYHSASDHDKDMVCLALHIQREKERSSVSRKGA